MKLLRPVFRKELSNNARRDDHLTAFVFLLCRVDVAPKVGHKFCLEAECPDERIGRNARLLSLLEEVSPPLPPPDQLAAHGTWCLP